MCQCGSLFRAKDRLRHEKSIKHLNYIKDIKDIKDIDENKK